ncbi:MAG: hypothetical protein DDT26_02283 [Dehalococcoidia bacterium]|nr:hypothetical protein [Chloroflexota bacterium]
MGLVYQKQSGLIRHYPAETIEFTRALIMPGDAKAKITAAEVSSDEVERLILKLDIMALETEHEGVTRLVADCADAVLAMMRWVKHETTFPFMSILGKGGQLDATWAEPKDVGGGILNPAGTPLLGLYGGASGGVFSWLRTFVANTALGIIPSQIMSARAGMLHMGMIDATQVPKVNRIRFTLAGQVGAAQPTKFSIRKGFGIEQMPYVRFARPVMIGPRQTQAIDLMPNISGDSRPELLSIIIAEASVLTL